MIRTLSVASVLLAAACIARGAVADPELDADLVDTPWCAAYQIDVDGQVQEALGCAETQALCERARQTARRIGKLAGILAVGPCQ